MIGQTCFSVSQSLAKDIGCEDEFARRDGADVLVADDEGEPVEDDQRHEEARDGHAEKGDGRGDPVAQPVLIDRADDAEADADQRRQQMAGGGDRERPPEPLGEQVGDRLVVDEGRAEIAVQHHAA